MRKKVWLSCLGAFALCGCITKNDSAQTSAAVGSSSAQVPIAGSPAAVVSIEAGVAPTTLVAGSASATLLGAGGIGGAAAPMPSSGAAGTNAPVAGTSAVAATAGAPAPIAINPAICPAAPVGTSDQAALALALINTYRVPTGAGCMTMISAINTSAVDHCAYYAAHRTDPACIIDPHLEVVTCSGFTGATPGDRMKAAGYTLFGSSELMAFVDSPALAVDTWVNSVWHRIPILDPWTTHLGYGSDTRCDTIDFGRGSTPAPANTIAVYPYDGQLNVPISFDGQTDAPGPPAPPRGWPSASPISVHAQNVIVTQHTLTLDGSAALIDHVWLDSDTDAVPADTRRTLLNSAFLYANTPFQANSRYRAQISGTYSGGTFSKSWTFTTGAAGK